MPRTRRSEAEARAEADLKFWGYHVGKQYAADGYPSDNPLLQLLSGRSDINPLSEQFGLNIRDIPADAWAINAVIQRLHMDHRRVLIGRYCLPVDYDTGQLIRAEVIADALRLHVRTYFRRLREAQRKYYLLSFVSLPLEALARSA